VEGERGDLRTLPEFSLRQLSANDDRQRSEVCEAGRIQCQEVSDAGLVVSWSQQSVEQRFASQAMCPMPVRTQQHGSRKGKCVFNFGNRPSLPRQLSCVVDRQRLSESSRVSGHMTQFGQNKGRGEASTR
jgi:hypothetical protein